jgi:hypothetical protein
MLVKLWDRSLVKLDLLNSRENVVKISLEPTIDAPLE